MAPLAPKCGALWGIYTLQGSNPTTSVTSLESKLGREFDLTLRYHDFSFSFPGQFPDQHEQELGKNRILFFSWQARVSSSRTDLSWRDIANGMYDSDFVVPAAQRIKSYGKQLFVAFDAEFDTHKTKGTMSDYVAAYRHIHDTFRRQGVTNVVWAWVSSGYTGAGNGDRINAGYPGDNYVDWVGFDPYNFYRCNTSAWKSFEQTIGPKYDWFIDQGYSDKPFVLSEYGTQFDSQSVQRSTDWHRDIPAVLGAYPNLKALIRFDANGTFGPNRCNLFIDNGPGMLDSFNDAGRHPLLNTR